MPKKRVSKKIDKGAVQDSPLTCSDVSANAFLYRYPEKSAFKITQKMLRNFWEESKAVGKNPILIIGIPNDDRSNFILRCTIEMESKGGRNSKK